MEKSQTEGCGKLYIVPTPVGNLEDITLRAIRVLREADMILAEDTRTSSVLLKHYDIHRPLQSHHKFNSSSLNKTTRFLPLRASEIRRGSQAISVMDATRYTTGTTIQTLKGAAATNGNYLFAFQTDGSNYGYASNVHNNSANTLYVDGHVGNLKDAASVLNGGTNPRTDSDQNNPTGAWYYMEPF